MTWFIKRLLTDRTFIFAVSISVCTIAFVFPWPVQPEELDFSYDPKGFVFGTSEMLFDENTSIYINIGSFEVKEGKANVTIDINYICQNRSRYNAAIFILQVPCLLGHVGVTTGASDPAFFGGNVTILTPIEKLSYILISIPKENQTFGKLEYMRLEFTVGRVLRRQNHYTYDFPLTFSTSFHDSITEMGLETWAINNLLFFECKSARLNIERPVLPYSILELTPQPDRIGEWYGKTWYRWDIKSLGSPQLISSSIIVRIEDENSKFWYQTRIGLSWFLFGFFIPLGLSSVIKIQQEPRIKMEVKPEPSYYPRTGNIAFYPLIIKNIGKTMAYECETNVSFRQKDAKEKELFNVKAKWSRTPEPLGALRRNGSQKLMPSLIPYSTIVNIKPNIPEELCLLIKDDNEKECYAWNARSYFYNHKNPEWKLDLGDYIAEVEVKGGNVQSSARFLIKNRGINSQDLVISKIS